MKTEINNPLKSFRILLLTALFYYFLSGSITSLSILYLTQTLTMPDDQAYNLFAAYNALIFLLPLLGGWLGTRLGYPSTISAGLAMALLCVPLLCIHNTACYLAGLSIFLISNALCTANFLGLLSRSCTTQNRSSRFLVFYVVINIGFFSAAIISGVIAQTYGYNNAFMAAGGIALLGCFTWWIANRACKKTFSTCFKVLLLLLIFSGLVFLLLQHLELTNALVWIIAIGTVMALLIYASRHPDKIARGKIIALLMLCFFSIGFWSLYMLEPSLLTLFIQNNVERHYTGITIPASSYYSLDAIFVIILGLLFSAVFKRLSLRNREPHVVLKFIAALLAMAIGYGVFVIGIELTQAPAFLTSSAWIVLGYIFLASGEVLIAPIGLSVVGSLLPAGKESIAMGIWEMFIGLSALISGYLANDASAPSNLSPIASNPIYAHHLLWLAGGSMLLAVVVLGFYPLLKKWLSTNPHGMASAAKP